MEDIRFYKHDGSLVTVINSYVRLKWETCLIDAGDVELTLTAPHKISDILEQDPYLVMEWHGHQATVVGVQYAENKVILRGKGLLTLLERRIVPEEGWTDNGTSEECIRKLLAKYASFLQIAPHTDITPENTFVFHEVCDLLTAAKQMLKGTGIGMDIKFDKGEFIFSFVKNEQTTIRISADNRNVHGISCRVPYGEIFNAGYCSRAFYPTVDVGMNDDLEDMNPNNFMRQYYLLYDRTLDGKLFRAGLYVYCDTPDGKLKKAYTEQKSVTQYICLADNPLKVFEQDLRPIGYEEAESFLKLRQFVSEDWSVVPGNAALQLGDMVAAEKTVGTEKGLKTLQVRRIVYDTALPEPCVSLEPLLELQNE